MEEGRICFTKEESFGVHPKEEEEEEDMGPPGFFKEDRGPADTVNAGRVYCYSSEEEDEDEEESKPWSERLRRRPRCVRVPVVSPIIRDRLDLGTFTPMMTSEPRLTSMMASSERHRTMTMPSVRLLDSGGLLQSLKRGHGENWEGRVAKKRGKHVKQVEVEEKVEKKVGSREVEKRRRRARSSSGEEERRVFRRRAGSDDEERRVLKRERQGGSDYGSLSSLDSDMLK